jgi:protein-tyrosine-phosphatase
MLRKQFEDVLAEFGEIVKRPLALDDDATATFVVDDEIIVNLQYLDESDVVVAFAPVGAFGSDDELPNQSEKALELLRLNEPGGIAEGFTLALDEEADLVLAMDRRSALELANADSFAAWIEALVRAVRAVSRHFAEHFPEEEEA